MKFHSEDEAVAIANNSEYGLAAYIQSNDLQRVHRLSERLNAGGVYNNGGFQINPHTPFGGIGISGFGKEGGRAGIDEFLHYKTVTIGVGAPIFPRSEEPTSELQSLMRISYDVFCLTKNTHITGNNTNPHLNPTKQ